MNERKSLAAWVQERNLSREQLVELTKLDQRVVEAIVAGRYTTSPKQRDRIANALGITPDEVWWGQTVGVDHMYGHGPQFGRSP